MRKSLKNFMVILALSLCLGACAEDEFAQNTVPGGGALIIDSTPAFSVAFPVVFFTTTPTTIAVNLGGRYATANGGIVNFTILLNIPNNNVFFQNIDLKDSGSTYVESGATSFTSTKISGSVNLTSVGANSIQGSFTATFTDATNKTRKIDQGNFVINAFGTNA